MTWAFGVFGALVPTLMMAGCVARPRMAGTAGKS